MFNVGFLKFLNTGLLFLIVFSTSQAQEGDLKFKHYTINEGLSQNTVYCLLQDKDGIIWVGTEDGLNKFDGYDFTYYKHEFRNSNSISHNQINALHEDQKGRIWIGTSDGLNVFDKVTEKFTRFSTGQVPSINSNDFVTSIFGDSKGNVWITTLQGLKLYNPEKENFSLFSYAHRRADAIMEDSHGIFWVSVDKDLRRFDPVQKRFIPLPGILENNTFLRKSFIRSMKQDQLRRIWIATESAGLFIYDGQANTLKHFKHIPSDNASLASNTVRDISFRNKQEVWLGTRDGLSIFNQKSQTFTNYKSDKYDSSSLSQNSVRTILNDKAGNMWLGTFWGGVNLLIPRYNMFKFVGAKTPNKPGFSYNMVSAIAGAKNGALWIGTEGAGLNFANLARSDFRSYALQPFSLNIGANTVKCILPEGEDLWLGTVNGLYHFDTSTSSLKSIPISVDNKEIVSMVKIGTALWLATNGSGLVLMNKDGKMSIFKVSPPGSSNVLTRNNISKIVKDRNNGLWIATTEGLCYLKDGKFKRYYHTEGNSYSLSNSSISTLFIDTKERLWVGTKGGGLNLYDKSSNRFYVIDKALGLSNDVIHAIEQDKKGHFWISTNNGLSRIVLSGKLPFTRKSVHVANFFVEDGLQSNQFMRNSSFQDENGDLFFGGINGLTYFHPDDIESNPYQPPVVFTEFLIRNKPVIEYSENSVLKKSINATNEIRLKHDQVFISFKFAALHFVNPGNNRYAYKLEGLNGDEEWHHVGNQRIATYTNLDAGTYVFRVKAANSDGLWSSQTKAIKIIVLPPWWETWWAYSLYTLIIATILYLYYSYSLKTAKLKNDLAFEHLIREKDNELYQRKLNFFTNLSHEIKTPITLILAPLEKLLSMNQGNNRVQNQLMLMRNNGERLMKLIHQLLDFRKFDSGHMKLQAAEGNLVTFVKEVVLAFDAYAKQLNILIRIEAGNKTLVLWFDRDKIEKVIYNLLSNALKFTKPGGKIVIRIMEAEAELAMPGFAVIEVEDNGIGIPRDRISTIFEPFKYYDEDGANAQGSGLGLAFARGLVELHGGEISVRSEPKRGEETGKTCFSVKLPLGRAHLNDSEIISDNQDTEDIINYDQANEMEVYGSSGDKSAEVLSNMEEKPILLVVEDNKDVMNFLVEHFEEKFITHTAFDGREGLDKAVSLIPDILISDVMMPNMSGTELCRLLKTDNRTSHVPVILLTARSQVVHELEGLETGADDYITKPFNISVIEARVWNLLAQRQKLRERYRKEITLQPANLAITSPDQVFLEKVMAYIEANIEEPGLNVEDLAKEVFMSRTTLYRKIKALTNQTTVEFVRSVRLKRAAQLLKAGTYSVNEVAYMAGFIDVDYFRKCFKEEYHKTPTEYKGNHVQD